VPHVLGLVAAQTPPPDSTVGPGVGGFLAIFAIAIATVLLIRSMVGHLRKVRYGPGPPDDEPQHVDGVDGMPDAEGPREPRDGA
jgi:hypothetical protein